MMHTEGKWARQLVALQKADGSFGWFHSLGKLSASPITTEQALGRLEVLGFTKDDACIQKALVYMHRCLVGEKKIPDREEKVQDWPVFCRMILAARIRRFTQDDEQANRVARQWAQVIEASFADDRWNPMIYEKVYCDVFHTSKKMGRVIHYANYYPVSLLAGELDEKTENSFLKQLISEPAGIYYVYEKAVAQPPEHFQSKQANRYLSALELLAGYQQASAHLAFAAEWLIQQRLPSGMWDMGRSVNDKTSFPLSDDWRKDETRIKDCSERIEKILHRIG